MHLCVCLCECLYEYRIPKRNHLADVGMIMMQTGMVNQGITSVMNTMEGTLSKPFPKTKQKKNNKKTNNLRFAALYPKNINTCLYLYPAKRLIRCC